MADIPAGVASLVERAASSVRSLARGGLPASEIVEVLKGRLRHGESLDRSFHALPLVASLHAKLDMIAASHIPDSKGGITDPADVNAREDAAVAAIRADSRFVAVRDAALRHARAASQPGTGAASPKTLLSSRSRMAALSARSKGTLLPLSRSPSGIPTPLRSPSLSRLSWSDTGSIDASADFDDGGPGTEEDSRVEALSFSQLPSLVLIKPLAFDMAKHANPKKRVEAAKQLLEYTPGDLLSSQQWNLVREGVCALLRDKSLRARDMGLRFFHRLFEAAECSVQTADIYLSLAAELLNQFTVSPRADVYKIDGSDEGGEGAHDSPPDVTFREAFEGSRPGRDGYPDPALMRWTLRAFRLFNRMQRSIPDSWLVYSDSQARRVLLATLRLLAVPRDAPGFVPADFMALAQPNPRWLRRWLVPYSMRLRMAEAAAEAKTLVRGAFSRALDRVERHVIAMLKRAGEFDRAENSEATASAPPGEIAALVTLMWFCALASLSRHRVVCTKMYPPPDVDRKVSLARRFLRLCARVLAAGVALRGGGAKDGDRKGKIGGSPIVEQRVLPHLVEAARDLLVHVAVSPPARALRAAQADLQPRTQRCLCYVDRADAPPPAAHVETRRSRTKRSKSAQSVHRARKRDMLSLPTIDHSILRLASLALEKADAAARAQPPRFGPAAALAPFLAVIKELDPDMLCAKPSAENLNTKPVADALCLLAAALAPATSSFASARKAWVGVAAALSSLVRSPTGARRAIRLGLSRTIAKCMSGGGSKDTHDTSSSGPALAPGTADLAMALASTPCGAFALRAEGCIGALVRCFWNKYWGSRYEQRAAPHFRIIASNLFMFKEALAASAPDLTRLVEDMDAVTAERESAEILSFESMFRRGALQPALLLQRALTSLGAAACLSSKVESERKAAVSVLGRIARGCVGDNVDVDRANLSLLVLTHACRSLPVLLGCLRDDANESLRDVLNATMPDAKKARSPSASIAGRRIAVGASRTADAKTQPARVPAVYLYAFSDGKPLAHHVDFSASDVPSGVISPTSLLMYTLRGHTQRAFPEIKDLPDGISPAGAPQRRAPKNGLRERFKKLVSSGFQASGATLTRRFLSDVSDLLEDAVRQGGGDDDAGGTGESAAARGGFGPGLDAIARAAAGVVGSAGNDASVGAFRRVIDGGGRDWCAVSLSLLLGASAAPDATEANRVSTLVATTARSRVRMDAAAHFAASLHAAEWLCGEVLSDIRGALENSGVSVAYIAAFWMASAFWGTLIPREALLYAALPSVYGAPRFHVYAVLAVLSHLREAIFDLAGQTTAPLALCEYLVNVRLEMFRFENHLDEMLQMEAAHGETMQRWMCAAERGGV